MDIEVFLAVEDNLFWIIMVQRLCPNLQIWCIRTYMLEIRLLYCIAKKSKSMYVESHDG